MKYLAFCDTETTHIGDLQAQGYDIRKVGNELHLFENDLDTGNLPTVSIKCISLVLFDCNNDELDEHGVPVLINEPVDKQVFTDMDAFWCYLCDKQIQYMYFHNLKYDESYIINPLLQFGDLTLSNGYTLSPLEKERNMSDMGKLFSMAYVLTKGKKHRVIKMRDAAKIYPMKLAKLGESFGMPKGKEALTIGITQELLDYCIMDSCIMGKAMVFYINMCRKETRGKIKYGWLTIARTTYELFFGNLEEHNKVPTLKKMFTQDGHPVWLRECYKGASPLFDRSLKAKLLDDIVLDVNSMYPYQMFTKWLPIGRPKPISADEIDSTDKLWVASCHIDADIKPGKRGCYLIKNKVAEDSTLIDHIEFYGVPQFITNVDYQMLKENYDIHYIEFDEIWAYDKAKGLPAPYITKWYTTKKVSKKTGDKAMETFSKLMLNSLYGKFGSRSHEDMVSAKYIINEKGALRKVLYNAPKHTRKGFGDNAVSKYGYYLPWAIFITSYARKMLIDSINALGWEHVHYTDTDSDHVHGLTVEEACTRLKNAGFRINKVALGAFDIENSGIYGKYYRNKGYCLFNSDGSVLKCKMAGATGGWKDATADTFDNVQLVQLKSYNVNGGVLLMDTPVSLDDSMLRSRKTRKQLHKEVEERGEIITEDDEVEVYGD